MSMTTPVPTPLDVARTHRNQFLDAAESGIVEIERLRARLTDAEALLREAAETARADAVERIRAFLG